LPSFDVIGGVLLFAYAELALFAKPDADLPGGVAAAAVAQGAWTSVLAGAFLLLLLFPNGQMPSARWRLVSRLMLCVFALVWFLIATLPSPDPPFDDFANPLSFTSGDAQAVVTYVLVVPILLAVVAAAVNLIIRFVRSTGDEREQFKWLCYPAAFLVVTLPLGILDGWEGLATVPFLLALLALPIAVGIAVLKYRLYEIDVIINRTLVYVPLTAILAGLFVASTALVRTVFTDLTDAGSDAAIALSTIAVVALLTPLKNQLQALVDRHFKEQQHPLARTRKLTNEASSVVKVLDTSRFVDTFLAELTSDLGALGARVEVYGPAGARRWSAGIEGELAPIRTPLTSGDDTIGELTVWPGTKAISNDQRLEEALDEAAGVLGQVLHLAPLLPGAGQAEAPEIQARSAIAQPRA
jgi:hypothetical protein